MELIYLLKVWSFVWGVFRCIYGLAAFIAPDKYISSNFTENKKNYFAGRMQGSWFFSLGVFLIITSFNLHIYSATLLNLCTYVTAFPSLLNEYLNHKTLNMKNFYPIFFVVIFSVTSLTYHLLTFDFKY